MTLFLFLKGKAAVGRKCFVLKGSESEQLFSISLHLFITFRVLPARIHFIFFLCILHFNHSSPSHPSTHSHSLKWLLQCSLVLCLDYMLQDNREMDEGKRAGAKEIENSRKDGERRGNKDTVTVTI